MMKQLIGGGIAVISGVLLFGFTLVAAAIYTLQMGSGGYYSEYGLYLSALWEVGMVPLVLSIIFFIIGLVLLFKATDNEWKGKYFLIAEDTKPNDTES